MWLSLLVTVITYLMSSRGTSAERRQALINAGLAGGATYVATEYTDWGSDLSDKFDGAIGLGSKATVLEDGTSVDSAGAITGPNGEIIKPAIPGAVGLPNKTPDKGSSLWETIASWGPATTALVAGGVGLAAGSGPNMLVIGGIILGAFLLLK